MNALADRDFCAALVLSLGHFLWQGTLIAGLVALVVRRTTSSHLRYRRLVAALTLMALCPVVTVGIHLMKSTSPVLPIAVKATEPSVPASVDSDLPPAASQTKSPTSGPPLPQDVSPGALAAIPVSPIEPPVDATAVGWQRFAPLLMNVYLLGVAGMLLRLVVGLWGGWRLRVRSTPVVDVVLLQALRRQATSLGMSFIPILAYCERVAVPTVIGILKPTILLPLSLTSGLSPQQVEAILAHELAHLRRFDHLVNLLQRVLESALFFHPAVWWLSNRIRIERELCCDDLVVACGAEPLDYAKSLLRVAELSRISKRSSSISAVSLLATGQSSKLRQRIARLLGDSSDTQVRFLHRWPAITLALVCLSIAFTTTQIGWNLAAEPTAKSEKIAATLPNGATVELLGVGYHKWNRNDWWGADGIRLPAAPQDADLKQSGFMQINAGAKQGDCREFAVRITGIPNVETRLGWQFLYEPYSDALHNGVIYESSEIRIAEMPPISSHKVKTATLRICMDELPTELVRSFDVDGKKLGDASKNAELRSVDDLIQPLRVEAANGQSELILKEYSRKLSIPFNEYAPEAIDNDGGRHQSIRAGGKPGVFSYLYPIPRQKIARFEYRLKLHRTWVTFENISLEPGTKTQPKVSVGKLPDEPEAAAQPTVIGTVVSSDGQPVPGIEVSAFKGANQLEQKFKTDDRGQFQVPKAWRTANQHLTVVARDGRERLGWFDFFMHGHSSNGQKSDDGSFRMMLLPLNRTIRGQLVDPSDKPLAGIPVQVEYLQHGLNFASAGWHRRMLVQEPVILGGVTDDKGRFEFKLPADSFSWLRVLHSDWAEERIEVKKEQTEVWSVKLRPAAKVAGRVTDSRTGKPVAGVGIGAQMVKPGTDSAGWGDAKTDVDGRYLIGGLGAGEFTIIVLEGADKTLTSAAQSPLPLKSGETAQANFSLSVGRRLHGRVVDSATGQPVPECYVSYSGPARPGPAVLGTQTNDKGEFEFFVPPGPSHVYVAEVRENVADSSRDVVVASEGDPEPVVLQAGPKSAGGLKIFVGPPLERIVSFHFQRSPLQTALEYLCQEAGVKLELDGDGLKSQGYTKNMPVTMQADNVTLQAALDQVLKPYVKLSYMLDKNVVLVSNKQEVEARGKAPNVVEKGLEFLAPYPKLRNLSLKMTEQDFLAIADQQKLTRHKHAADGNRISYWIPTGDGHTVIVMFLDGKCRGIQRIRGEDPKPQAELVEAVGSRVIALASGKVISTDANTIYVRMTDKGEQSVERSDLQEGNQIRFDLDPAGKVAIKVIITQPKTEPQPAPGNPPEPNAGKGLGTTGDWGKPTNGLRARIMPVSADMNEDEIDPANPVNAFKQLDDVAFVVELENVSGKPVKLLDTRYGDGYGESKGKANSNWYGQYLFSIDYFDDEGKQIERPEVQVVDLNSPLDGALVATLEPGKTHRCLLRPAKWLSVLSQRLEPGSYQASIRYHGLPARVAERIKEYRPKSTSLDAVAGDIVSPRISFSISADADAPNAAPRPKLVWGQPVNGLRAAMEIAPHKAAHHYGEKPDLKLHVQNVSEMPITLAAHLWLSSIPAAAKDANGQPLVIDATDYSGWTLSGRITLQPNQMTIFDAGNLGLAETKEQADKFEHITNRKLLAPIGQMTVQLSERFGQSFLLKDGKGKQLAPLEGDYQGELTTGATPLVVAKPAPADIKKKEDAKGGNKAAKPDDM